MKVVGSGSARCGDKGRDGEGREVGLLAEELRARKLPRSLLVEVSAGW